MPEVVGILEVTWPLLLSLVRSCVYARNKVVSSRGPAAPSLAIHGPFDERDFARVMRPHRISVRLVKPDIALKKQANTLNLRLRSGRGLVARHECPVMGWSGRAPAPPASEAGKGHQRQGARHVSDTQYRDRRDRHRYRQELVPPRGPPCAPRP